MLYGATGYTGRLIAERAVKQGHRPLLAGRDPEKLKPMADALGLSFTSFSLDDGASTREALSRVKAVFHAAGPFLTTGKAMLDACLDKRCHYLDLTGELAVLEAAMLRGAEAERAGILAVPGSGFDVVPSDCLAKKLSLMLPSATHLEIAIGGFGALSPGTVASLLGSSLLYGNRIRRDGQLIEEPFAARRKRIALGPKRRKRVGSMPVGDVVTAFFSTKIPNITAYLALPPFGVSFVRSLRAMAKRPALHRAMLSLGRRFSKGPSERHRTEKKCYLWGKVEDASGNAVEAAMTTKEPYEYTAHIAVLAVEEALISTRKGVLTPALAFGEGFAERVEGTSVATSRPVSG